MSVLDDQRKVKVYQSLFSQSVDAVMYLNNDGQLVEMNESTQRLLGYSFDELKDDQYRRIFGPGQEDYINFLIAGAMLGEAQEDELLVSHKAGRQIPVLLKVTPVMVEGSAMGVFCSFQDMTDQQLLRDQLIESEQRYRALFDYNADAVLLFDQKGNLVRHNLAFEELAGRPSALLLGQGFHAFFADDIDEAVEVIGDALLGEQKQGELRAKGANDKTVYTLVNTVPIWVNNQVVGAYMVVKDITNQRKAEQQIAHMALHDALTGLPNRTLLFNRLEELTQRTRGQKGQFAILFLDLDGFKFVNDTLGHPAGDNLLVQVGRRLIGSVRKEDTVARLGGDEFAILIEGIDHRAEVEELAQRVISRIHEPFLVSGQSVTVGASAGIVYNDGCGDPDELLRRADIAMYQAKNKGKGRYVIFTDEMGVKLSEKLALEQALRKAVQQEELLVHYQPLYNLRSKSIVGFEALVRWRHPQQGIIPPGEFIPLAEETQQIIDIDHFVFETACKQVAAWNKEFGGPPLHLSVNLSAVQFQNPHLVKQIAAVLKKTDIKPEHVQLEITETAMTIDHDRAKRVLMALKKLGVRIAIDDFGTGYSSVAYIRDWPVDTIKIDRKFIQELGKSPVDQALVRAVISFAREIGLVVYGEGIETEEQANILLALHCEHGQGFCFEQPMPAEAVGPILMEQRTNSNIGKGATPS